MRYDVLRVALERVYELPRRSASERYAGAPPPRRLPFQRRSSRYAMLSRCRFDDFTCFDFATSIYAADYADAA